jgi:steroid 5-alpha reductase family enzyme
MTVLYPEALAGKQQMPRSRGACYRDYQSRTGMFFPLPPQKGVAI